MMRFTCVCLAALFCLSAGATGTEKAIGDKDSDDAIVAAAEKMMKEGAKDPAAVTGETGATAANPPAASAPTAAATKTIDIKKESEMPVFLKSEKSDKNSEPPLVWRLIASLAIIALVGGALIFSAKRWTRQANKGGEKARIEIMHQLHLGPKKSVALIRVAGEAMLLGITDHSVNLIKPVTLIDDEMQAAFSEGLNNFLEDEFAIEDVRTAIGSPRART